MAKTSFNEEHLAAEAERLRKDPVLIYAVQQLRQEAMENLVRCDPSDLAAVTRLQAKADVAEEFVLQLARYIAAINPDEFYAALS